METKMDSKGAENGSNKTNKEGESNSENDSHNN